MKNLYVALLLFVSLGFVASIEAASVTLKVTVIGTGAGKVEIKNPSGALVLKCSTANGSCSTNVASGQQLTVVTTPETGASFNNISGTGSANCLGTGPCSFAITVPTTLTIAFKSGAPAQFSLNFGGAGSGQVVGKFNAGTVALNCSSPSACIKQLSSGILLTFNATPQLNSGFAGWSNGTGGASVCNGTSAPCTIVFSGNTSLTANFSGPKFKVSVATAQTGTGTITSELVTGINCKSGALHSSCATQVESGKTIRLRATPDAGSSFSIWSGGTGSAAVCNNSHNTVCEFKVDAISSIKANFPLSNL